MILRQAKCMVLPKIYNKVFRSLFNLIKELLQTRIFSEGIGHENQRPLQLIQIDLAQALDFKLGYLFDIYPFRYALLVNN